MEIYHTPHPEKMNMNGEHASPWNLFAVKEIIMVSLWYHHLANNLIYDVINARNTCQSTFDGSG